MVHPHRGWACVRLLAAAAAATLGGALFGLPPSRAPQIATANRVADETVAPALSAQGESRLTCDAAEAHPAAFARLQNKSRRYASRGPKRFDEPAAAMEMFIEERLAPGMTVLPMERLRAELAALRVRQSQVESLRSNPGDILGWQELGPGNIGGRTRGFVVDPSNPNVLYAGGVAGGVWKTTDGGANWVALDDFMLNIAVCSLAIDPTNPQVLYAGTGENFFNGDAVRGLGIFKTSDGGATWTQLPGTGTANGDFFRVSDIVISPVTSQRVYAATRFGVYRSTDGGATWTQMLRNPDFGGPAAPTLNGTTIGCTDLAIKQTGGTSSDTLFAAFGSFDADGLYRSTDSGVNWSRVGSGADLIRVDQGRMSVAIAPSSANTIYVVMANNGGSDSTGTIINVFRSTDNGNNWSPRLNFGHPFSDFLQSNLVFGTGCAGSSNFAQGWYDQAIAVDPADEKIVWIGGVDLFRSTDSGQNFQVADYWYADPGTPWYVHADKHNIVFDPGYNGTSNRRMYVTTDGGVFRTDDARAAASDNDCPFCDPNFDPNCAPYPQFNWQELNNSYGVTQFYHGDVASDADWFGGGTQDNGTLLVRSTGDINGWDMIFGGDGGYFQIDPTDRNIMFQETQRFPNIRKSTDGGLNFFDSDDGITDSDGLFITPFAMDQTNTQILWTGGTRPWRTTDGGDNWTLATNNPSNPFPAGSQITAIASAPTDSNVVYMGFTNGIVARTTNGLGATPAWTEFGGGNGLPNGRVSSLEVDPTNPNIAYVTYSTFDIDHIYRTTNGGTSWTSLDSLSAAGIPDIPVHWIEVRPCDATQLYVGTELGVFASDDDGVTWQPANAGLANTVVETLDFQNEDRLVAFTHGRGAFVTDLTPCGACPDGDGDGICDPNDGCPADPLKDDPGACGCGNPETDGDGDGTPDCLDGCPGDPAKTAPGECGCGVSDADSDSDGTPDCDDGCPGDPGKTAPGACGCGVSDADSDSDGTPDCDDGCPNDPAKTGPGLCGCGVAEGTCCPGDADADGDVDLDDLLIVLGSFGASGMPPFTGGDTDGDGDVDLDDLLLVLGNFGSNCG